MVKIKVLLLFTFLSFLLFWPIFLGKVNLNGNLLVSFYPIFGENLPFKNTGWDQLRIYFPFYKITLAAFKNFQLPLWNPYAFSGHPHMADFQSGVFYPLNVFGLMLGQIEFWHLLRILPSILASFFTFLYLRSLKLANLPAIFGAIIFGFSPFILTWGEEVVLSPHSIIWMPLILFAIERFLESKKKIFLAIISLSTAFSFFGGYMQTTIYMFLFIFAYLVFRFWQGTAGANVKHPWGGLALHLRILVSFVLGAGIAAIQLLPSAELYFNAARSQIALRDQLFNFLLPIETLITYFAPDFFGHPATGNFFRLGDAQYYEGILFAGIPTLIFAGYMVFRKNTGGLVKFLAIAFAVSLLTTFNLPTSRFFLSLPIPFLSTSIPNRVLFMPVFVLAVLAAGGFDKWLVSGDRRILRVIFSILAFYAALVLLLLIFKVFGLPYFDHAKFTSAGNIMVSLRNLVIPLGVFALSGFLIILGTLRGKLKQKMAILIIAVSLVHVFYFSQKYFSFSDRRYVFPQSAALSFIKDNQGIYRSWSVGDVYLENNFASQYGLFWPEGYDSLNNRSYGEFTYAMQGNDIGDFVFRADAGLGRDKVSELLENQSRRRLVDMAGVKYVIGTSDEEQVLSQNNFKKVFRQDRVAVYENLQVMPRIFLASNYEGPPQIKDEGLMTKDEIQRMAKERRKLIPQKLLRDDFDFRNVLILEKPSPISPQFGDGSVEIEKYEPTDVIVKTQSAEPKLLFLSDNYYPGWKAKVDGDEVPILRANYTFRAVPLGPGAHEVRFYYDSDVFKLGLLVTFSSLAVLAYLTLIRNRLAG